MKTTNTITTNGTKEHNALFPISFVPFVSFVVQAFLFLNFNHE
jgi:hypothetical protein